MNIKKIIREEIDGFKDSNEEDWAWSENDDLFNFSETGVSLIYYYPPITRMEYNTYVRPSLKKEFPNYPQKLQNGVSTYDHTEIHSFEGILTASLLDTLQDMDYIPDNEEEFLSEFDDHTERSDMIDGREVFSIPNDNLTESDNTWEDFEETSAVIDRLHEWMTKHDKEDLTNVVVDFNKPTDTGHISPFFHIFEELGVPNIEKFFKDMEGVEVWNLWIDSGGEMTYNDESLDEYVGGGNDNLSFIDDDTVLDSYDYSSYKILDSSEIFGI